MFNFAGNYLVEETVNSFFDTYKTFQVMKNIGEIMENYSSRKTSKFQRKLSKRKLMEMEKSKYFQLTCFLISRNDVDVMHVIYKKEKSDISLILFKTTSTIAF